MMLTPTMMLARLERGTMDCPTVREALDVIVARYGREVAHCVGDLLVSLSTDRARVLREIRVLIHASPVHDKGA